MFEELQLDEVIGHDSIVFVCHSMGGLVVRRMLVQQINKLAGKQLGLVLVASPSMGSTYANWITPIARFFGHTQADVLRMGEDNQWLMSLDDDFLDLLDKHDISGRELYEDISIFRSGLLSLGPIVSPLSARRYFRDSLKIPGTDHFTIAKPENSKALQHRVLIEFIRQRQQAHTQEVSAVDKDGPTAMTGSTEPSAAELLAHENLADYLLAADEFALRRLVASVPPGGGVEAHFVTEKFRREYLSATDSQDIHNRVAAASALVNASYPEFQGRSYLVSVVSGELNAVKDAPTNVLQSALTASRLKGPRTLAAFIAEAPLPAVIAARNDVDAMLRALLNGEAS
ncbi:hypothetical protein WT33_22595 [Burkholderia stagnalis]|nr:hypothetical protein WT33_22595 [Burkholderia stagnalis]